MFTYYIIVHITYYFINGVTFPNVFIDIAEGDWKQQYYNHTLSFRNQIYKNDKSFSSFCLELK